MIISRNQNTLIPISVKGKTLDRLYQFKYFRTSIDAKLDTEPEIKSRIEQARGNSTRIRDILSD